MRLFLIIKCCYDFLEHFSTKTSVTIFSNLVTFLWFSCMKRHLYFINNQTTCIPRIHEIKKNVNCFLKFHESQQKTCFWSELAPPERVQKRSCFSNTIFNWILKFFDYCASIVAELELERRRCILNNESALIQLPYIKI